MENLVAKGGREFVVTVWLWTASSGPLASS